jgi:hypothetical protein
MQIVTTRRIILVFSREYLHWRRCIPKSQVATQQRECRRHIVGCAWPVPARRLLHDARDRVLVPHHDEARGVGAHVRLLGAAGPFNRLILQPLCVITYVLRSGTARGSGRLHAGESSWLPLCWATLLG